MYIAPMFGTKNMIITASDLSLLYQIELHCEKCICACLYFEAVSGTDDKMWAFAQNCFGESAILHWSKSFASRKEPTHFTRFFVEKLFKMPDGSALTLEIVRSKLYAAAMMSADEYLAFWKNLKRGRDKYFVHNDFSATLRPHFPDLDVLKKVALEMRNVIYEVIVNEESEDVERHKDFKDLVEWNRNDKYLRDLEKDCQRLKQMMKTE
jgi:hypothetical protein